MDVAKWECLNLSAWTHHTQTKLHSNAHMISYTDKLMRQNVCEQNCIPSNRTPIQCSCMFLLPNFIIFIPLFGMVYSFVCVCKIIQARCIRTKRLRSECLQFCLRTLTPNALRDMRWWVIDVDWYVCRQQKKLLNRTKPNQIGLDCVIYFNEQKNGNE